MKTTVHLLGCIAVLALALGAAAQTNQTIPPDRPAPGTEIPPPPATPPPGTQDDRQIPEGGRNQNQNQTNQQDNRGQSIPAAAQSGTAAQGGFAETAAKGALAEMQMGQLAREKGSTDNVRAFGQMLVDDHSDALKKIKDIAAKENITIGSEIEAKHKAAYDRLSALSGPEFDRAFATQMVNDHQEAIAEYERESTSGSSTDWRDFAKDSLETLSKHLEEAQKLSAATPTSTDRPDTNRGTTPAPDSSPSRDNIDPSYGSPAPAR